MNDTPETTGKEHSPKEKYIRETISYLTSDKAVFYIRGDRVYIDTTVLKGSKMLLLEGAEFRSFLLKLAKVKDGLLLRGADADLIVDHVRYHAAEVAVPLAADARAEYVPEGLLINTGWSGGKYVLIKKDGTWTEDTSYSRIFEPMNMKMAMIKPEMRSATQFSNYLRTGIGDFAENHCLLCVTCATLLLPADFVHPFIVFTGQQARGKSTTMKLLTQLVDPYAGGELMTVGEDMRDIIALVRGRHSIALDNVSRLPFDEDLLSKMYSGGVFAARKMTTNSELSEVEMPRMRVMINGIGAAFSRSDLMSRCIFIDHPILTTKEQGKEEQFQALHAIEQRWHKILPEALGSLFSALGEGLKLYNERGGIADKTSSSRFVEYCIIGECISEAMGYPKGLFTEQVRAAGEMQKEGAIAADDCAQLIIAWLEGERGGEAQIDWMSKQVTVTNERTIKTSDLFMEIRNLASSRGYSVFSLKWMASVKSFSLAIVRSQKNIENAGWISSQVKGGEHKRNWNFIKIQK